MRWDGAGYHCRRMLAQLLEPKGQLRCRYPAGGVIMAAILHDAMEVAALGDARLERAADDALKQQRRGCTKTASLSPNVRACEMEKESNATRHNSAQLGTISKKLCCVVEVV